MSGVRQRGGPRSGATSRDVARAAGASQATVSRVINGHASVAPEVRDRVERAMADLGYVPNAAARSLVTQRTGVLGLLVTNITNAYFAEIVDGAAGRARERGYGLLLGLVPGRREGEPEPGHTLRLLAAQRVDGLVATSALEGDAAAVAHLVGGRIPITGIGPAAGVPYDTVAVDYRGGTRLATAHLLGHGRRRLAYVGGRRDSRAAVEHRLGFEDAMASAGIEPDPRLVSEGEFSYASALERTRDLLAGDARIDGIVLPADTMALGALDALADASRPVPDDVAVVGFDDVAAAGLRAVALTTVRSEPARLGAMAVDRLVDRIEGVADGPAIHRVVPAELVLRGSCGRHG